MNKKDYIGKKIGILTIIEETDEYHPNFKRKSKLYICKCECGNTCKKAAACFSSMKSCGCLHKHNKKNLWKKAKIGPKLEPGIPAFNIQYNNYVKSAKKRNLSFCLSKEQFLKIVTSEACFYCGTKEKRKIFSHKKRVPFLSFGVDRVDNSKGYLLENCVPCCKICNRAKDVLTKQEFISWITNVYKNLVLPSELANVPR